MSNPSDIQPNAHMGTQISDDAGGRSKFDEPAEEHVQDSPALIQDLLQGHGLAFMHGISLTQFSGVMRSLGRLFAHPDADADGVTRIIPDGRQAQRGGGFTREALPLHTDRALTESPPQYLGIYFLSKRQDSGGDPIFCQLDLALSALTAETLRQLVLREHGGSMVYPLFMGRWAHSNRFRFRDDAHCSIEGPPQLVRQVADRVTAMTISAPWMASGDAYILDNTRVLHGRTAFDDPSRSVARILVEAA